MVAKTTGRKGFLKPKFFLKALKPRILIFRIGPEGEIASCDISLSYLVLNEVLFFEMDTSVLVARCFEDVDAAASASVVVAVRTSIPLDGRDETDD